MEETNRSKGLSWGVVILLFILFWPVGLFLLYKKLIEDKKALLKNSKVLKGFGWTFLIFGIIGMTTIPNLVESNDQEAGVVMFVFFMMFLILVGITMLIRARRMKKSGEKYRKYMVVIANQNKIFIDHIAAAVSADYDDVIQDLQRMIDIGYLEDAYIDVAHREVVLNREDTAAASIMGQSVMNKSASPTTKVVTCKNCGANNTIIVGVVNECEFCGSPIQ